MKYFPAETPGAIVVVNALAARQWELVLSASHLTAATSAWETSPLVPYGEWLERLWERRPGVVLPLTASQSRALWRRIVAESPEATQLIAPGGVAAWAENAWQLLLRWCIDPAGQRARADEPDFAALLRWCGRYRDTLADLNVVDRVEVERQLAATIDFPSDAVLADLGDDYPLRDSLVARLTAAGSRLVRYAAPAVVGARRAVRLADPADEVETALRWASAELTSAPSSRIAIVIADLQRRHEEVQRFIDAELPGSQGHLAWYGGAPLLANPAIGAAVAALRLLTATTGHTDFGRWLRSPFFDATPLEREQRALLEARLRTDLRAQPPFMAAYRSGGLAEIVHRHAASTAERLDRAVRAVDVSRRATPGHWAREWSGYLERLGWQAPRDAEAARAWQAALDALAQLTPIIGAIALPHALAELGAMLERRVAAPLPLRGVHLLTSIDDVGPGYDAVWLTGFTDRLWPEPARPNPLLPHALQRAHGMPGSSPRTIVESAARRLSRIVNSTPVTIASWPARVLDHETEASPAIRDWPELALPARVGRSGSTAQACPRETVDDPPPRFAGSALPGGAGMLTRQARCPLRAFAEDRLRARPLEPIAFGLARHARGTAAHRAAERLASDLPEQAALIDRAAEVAVVSEQVLRELFGRSRQLLRPLYDLEVAQLRTALAALLEAERRRAPFRVVAVEQASTVQLGQWSIDVRVDRLDRLADGTLAILDYKTGQSATSAAWFKPRLQDVQVPLYATTKPGAIGATAIVRLRPERVTYSGLWAAEAFPGRVSAAWDGDWPAQAARWRAELSRLASEFAAGDTRIFLDAYDEAGGDYATLTRVHEQLALRRGAIRAW